MSLPRRDDRMAREVATRAAAAVYRAVFVKLTDDGTAQVKGRGDVVHAPSEFDMSFPPGYYCPPTADDEVVAVTDPSGVDVIVAVRAELPSNVKSNTGGPTLWDPSGNRVYLKGSDGMVLEPVSGKKITLVSSGAKAAARLGDATSAAENMTTWMTQVATYINTLAPGTVNPALPPRFGEISAGSSKVEIG